MKKRVTAELISIAHRILKLKNHAETLQLQQEAKNLYDQLTILRFYEENFELVKQEIPQEILEDKLEGKPTEVFNAPIEEEMIEKKDEEAQLEPIVPEKIVIAELIIEDDEEEDLISSNDDEIIKDEPIVEAPKSDDPITKQITFEDLLAADYKELEFVKVEDIPAAVEKAADIVFEAKNNVAEEVIEEVVVQSKPIEPTRIIEEEIKATQINTIQEPKISSLNDRLNKTISFGLNDRIGFEKKLFGGSSDDFNRVISQLNTFDSFEEAKGFVQDFVKPDYNNWEGNEEFETRFMEIVEKKFS